MRWTGQRTTPALVLAIFVPLTMSAGAQQPPSPEGCPSVSVPLRPQPIKGQSVYATPPPGQVGGPVLSHPELNTPERLKEETEAVKEYCRTHDCGSNIVDPRPGGESIDRAMRAWAARHPGFGEGKADPSNTNVCEADPAHPEGPDICYRASDHSRVYPGTPDKN